MASHGWRGGGAGVAGAADGGAARVALLRAARGRDERGSESEIGELNGSGERLSGGGGRRRGDAWHRRHGTPPTWHKQGSTMTKIE